MRKKALRSLTLTALAVAAMVAWLERAGDRPVASSKPEVKTAASPSQPALLAPPATLGPLAPGRAPVSRAAEALRTLGYVENAPVEASAKLRDARGDHDRERRDFNTEAYDHIADNAFLAAATVWSSV